MSSSSDHRTREGTTSVGLASSYAGLVAAYAQPAWWIDETGVLALVNAPWVVETGLTLEASRDGGWLAALHPDDVERARSAGPAEVPTEVEVRLRRAVGGERRVLLRHVPVNDRDGTVRGWFVALSDVDEPPDAPARDDAARRVIESLMTTAPPGMAFLDRDGRYIRTSINVHDVHGEGARVGRTVAELFPDVWRQCEPHFSAVVEGGPPVRFAITGPTASGARSTWEVAYFPVHDDDRVVGVVATATDVTAHADEQAEAEALREQIAQQRDLLEAIFANAPVGAAVLDHEARYVRANDALARMNGTPAGSHVGRTVREVAGDAVWEAARAEFEHVLSTGEPRQFEFSAPTPGTGGEAQHWFVSYYPIRSRGVVDGVGAVIVDLTDHRRAEARLVALNERLSEFVSVAAHEIRTPLTSVAGYAGRLRRLLDRRAADSRADASADVALHEAVDVLADEADRLRRTVDLFLDLARIDTVRPPPEVSEVDLVALVDARLREYRRRYPAATIRLRRPAEPVVALANEDGVSQILGNLIDNAVKYGDDDPHVTVSVEGDAARCVVRVADGGPGLAPEVRAHLFERYFRGPGDQQRRRGHGIGLYISREMAREMGGDLEAATPAAGAEFVLSLPASG